jgi:hypothetical protein
MADLLSLLDDLKEQIFMCPSLPCKYLIALSVTCKDLYQFIKNNDLVNKRKYLGFPRASGHCQVYDINKIVCEYYSSYDSTFHRFYRGDFEDIMRNKDHENDHENDELYYNLNNFILDKLSNSGCELVRGDVLCYGDYMCVFDGYKIVLLNYNLDLTMSMPLDFTIINNNVPVKYWDSAVGDCRYLAFDINDNIRNELINNVKDDGDIYFSKNYKLSEYAINLDVVYTHFMLYDEKYHIISYAGDEDIEENMRRFKDILSTHSKIILYYADLDLIFDDITVIPNNIVLLDLDDNEDYNFEEDDSLEIPYTEIKDV